MSGLELGGGSSAACRGADILHLNGSSLRPAAALSSGAAFFTVESSCAQPSLLRLELSRDSPAAHGGSPLARPLRQLASGAAHRKLLQGQQVVQMPANGSAAPGALPAVGGDKVTPLQPIPAASRPGSPSPAPGPAPGPEQACCCRYVAGVLPYDPQTVGGFVGRSCCRDEAPTKEHRWRGMWLRCAAPVPEPLPTEPLLPTPPLAAVPRSPVLLRPSSQ